MKKLDITFDGILAFALGMFIVASIILSVIIIVPDSEENHKYTYTQGDIDLCCSFVLKELTPTEEQVLRYDLNKDGKLSSSDLTIMARSMD